MDITQLILDDHHEQRRLFAILEQVDRTDTGTLSVLWARLAAFLEVHAAAEEQVFYPELLRVGRRTGRVGTAEEETLDAIHDHNDIRDAIAAVADHVVGSDGWYDGVAAVNLARLQQRHDLAVAFTAFEARHFAGIEPVDKDPVTYVREAERASRPRLSTGSLGIGSLKGL